MRRSCKAWLAQRTSWTCQTRSARCSAHSDLRQQEQELELELAWVQVLVLVWVQAQVLA